MKARIAVIGNGNVGSALSRAFDRAGHEVRTVGNDPAVVKEAGAWSEIVVLAVPYQALEATLAELGDGINGKVVVDVTNPLTPEFQPALGFATSAAEQLQEKAPGARIVKAFNTVFAPLMDAGQVNGTSLTLLAAGDDQPAKQQVLALGRDLGFDSVDAGPLLNARLLEALGYLNIQLGFTLQMGTSIGFKLIH